MRFDSKYEIDQHVWVVMETTAHRIVACSPCESRGKVNIGGEEFVCPKCGGRSAHPQYAGLRYFLHADGRVGKITVEYMPDNPYPSECDRPLKISYMLDSTGYPSGSVYKEEQLFPSREMAEQVMAERNAALLPDEAMMGERMLR